MPGQTHESYLRRAKINQDTFDKVGLKWDELDAISKSYEMEIPELVKVSKYISTDLMDVKNAHSVRFRVKDAQHLIDKIIRKRVKDSERIITVNNYLQEITDLVGVRVIHLLKNHWQPIHKYITTTYDLHEQPIAYIREGDSKAYQETFKEAGFKVVVHDFGYRSLHYIVPTKPGKKNYFVEIQVRTIFEEGWSEIDHKVRYPNAVDNTLYSEFLSIFNRLAGSADEMGSFIITLKNELFEKEMLFKEQIREKDKIIKQLNDKINKLKIEPAEKEEIVKSLQTIDSIDFSKLTSSLTETIMGIRFPTMTHQTAPSLTSDFIARAVKAKKESQKKK